MSDDRSSSHVYWQCKHHIVWTPKYRFKIVMCNVIKELYKYSNMNYCEVLQLIIQPDHAHLVIIVPLNISTSIGFVS
ncbi:TPA: IS200/IS605 family transposase [Vibrio parahaemolyticus]|nr:IS200/IS605 family transposase [Vibrio parahaemolyticus]MBE3803932.1 IS200/IS605 family transposase [Vibrio parahaemolyticus]MBE3812365.1 IS200/IS605 family transposase [Vibrio parahaemolyticus]MBE4232125.1 IS200/IS605 family transposase [Vibrio parahaemolyticus]MBE4395111.1 IS200/IS605 family transposase [Vibrio parahaemolyticus]